MDMQKDIQELYERLEAHGECDLPGTHIIDTAEDKCGGEGEFRVYHRDGYCFHVIKSTETWNADGRTYHYNLDTYFDGFKDITAKEALDLIPKKTNQ